MTPYRSTATLLILTGTWTTPGTPITRGPYRSANVRARLLRWRKRYAAVVEAAERRQDEAVRRVWGNR